MPVGRAVAKLNQVVGLHAGQPTLGEFPVHKLNLEPNGFSRFNKVSQLHCPILGGGNVK